MPLIFGSAGADTITPWLATLPILELPGDGPDSIAGLEGNDSLDGGGGADALDGGLGADTLRGGEGADALFGDRDANLLDGGGGDDLINLFGVGTDGFAAAETVQGGAGRDRLSLVVHLQSLLDPEIGVLREVAERRLDLAAGTVIVRLAEDPVEQAAAADVLVGRIVAAPETGLSSIEDAEGSALPDALTGDDGANLLAGRGAADTLAGAAGEDTLDGGAGDDLLVGGAGADSLAGGDGFDIAGHAGAAGALRVSLAAPAGNSGEAAGDQYLGVEGLEGGGFDDTLLGDAAANLLRGAAGNDLLEGLGSDDTLDGGGGNDTLRGGAGSNRLEGGAGDDLLHAFAAAQNRDTIDGGEGWDTLSLREAATFHVFPLNPSVTYFLASHTVDLHTGASRSLFEPGAFGFAPNIVVYPLLVRDASGFVTVEAVLGGPNENTLSGDARDNFLRGNSDNDTLNGREGNDTLEGGWLSDSLIGGQGRDMVSHENAGAGLRASLGTPSLNTGEAAGDQYSGIEDLRGSRFADDLSGDAAANRIEGLAGADTLAGAAGDTLEGGADGDTYIAELALAVILETGTAGRDRLVSAANVDALPDVLEDLTLAGTAQHGTGNAAGNHMVGNAQPNRLRGEGGADTLEGGIGDTLEGGAEGDTYIADPALADIRETGTTGRDRLISARGVEALPQELEDLTLTGAAILGTGNAGANLLLGNTLANVLIGGAGGDTLDGGAGADVLFGGSGRDAFLVDDPGDLVLDEADMPGLVVATLSWALGANLAELRLLGGGDHSGTGNALDNAIAGTAGANLLRGLGGADTIDGGGGNDRLVGGAGSDSLSGAEGQDRIFGQSGDDLLLGGDARDVLLGEEGADTLDGGAGPDLLTGGLGQDVFRLSALPDGTGFLRITDFAAGERIEIMLAALDPDGTAGLLAGSLAALPGRFATNLTGGAPTAGTRFTYETDRGRLWFDADGNGAAPRALLAQLDGLPPLAAADIWLA